MPPLPPRACALQVVGEFLGKGFLTPVTLHELWDIAARGYAAVIARAAGHDK